MELKRALGSSLVALLASIATVSSAHAQGPQTLNDVIVSADVLTKMNPRTMSVGPKGQTGTRLSPLARSTGVPGVDSLINFTDQFTTPGFDSNDNPKTVWPYEMVGRAPESGIPSVIHMPIIPVVVDVLGPDGKPAMLNGKPIVFDPREFVQPLLRSPMFQPFQYGAGFTQFNDAMMRTQFWDRIQHGADSYHVLLAPTVETTRHMHVPFGSYVIFVDANNQPIALGIESNAFTSLLFPATSPVDNSTPIGAAELAGEMKTRDMTELLFDNVVLYNGTPDVCCTLGFHSYDFEPGDARNGNRERRFVMNYSSWIAPELFAFGFQDITAISHEIAETFADPFVDDETPWWLSVDPFFGFSLCQNNLETGDVIEVLSADPVFPIQMNGRTYHPQNEALLPWFAFQSPSKAKGGTYSFPDETTLLHLSPAGLHPGCL